MTRELWKGCSTFFFFFLFGAFHRGNCSFINFKSPSFFSSQVLLVGNKSDMEHERTVTTAKGQQLADVLGYPFMEASAKSGTNVSEVSVLRCWGDSCEKVQEASAAAKWKQITR